MCLPQHLCLRGTTDYWVNDALGLPFFSVERVVDHGLLEALSSDIVPRLLQEVPGQPTAEQLQADQSDLTDLTDQQRWALYARWLEHSLGSYFHGDWPPECRKYHSCQ